MVEKVEENRNRLDEERAYEKVPAWAGKVAPLVGILRITTNDGIILDDRHDERADEDFLAKNVLLWAPHIYLF